MRRRRRGPIANAVLFVGALFLIIYFNRDQPSKNKFQWTKIRYETTSTTLPEPRGSCPGLSETTKPVLIVARILKDDPKWLDTLKDLYHVCLYTADAPLDKTSSNLQLPANRGHESMAYLTFLIDNYSRIPAEGLIFIHGSRFAWHNDHPVYDNLPLLQALNVSVALSPMGYYNLRCDWSAGTCDPKEALPQGSVETNARAVLEPGNLRAKADRALPGALASLFGGGKEKVLLGRTDAVRAQCCAQFAVSRERVWQHSRDEYVALRQWLLDGSGESGLRNENAAPRNDLVAGRILSYVWHILFIGLGESDGVNLERLNAMACPRADECYCRLYGRCDLHECRTPGHCRGQYRVPPGYRLPGDWEGKHS